MYIIERMRRVETPLKIKMSSGVRLEIEILKKAFLNLVSRKKKEIVISLKREKFEESLRRDGYVKSFWVTAAGLIRLVICLLLMIDYAWMSVRLPK